MLFFIVTKSQDIYTLQGHTKIENRYERISRLQKLINSSLVNLKSQTRYCSDSAIF